MARHLFRRMLSLVLACALAIAGTSVLTLARPRISLAAAAPAPAPLISANLPAYTNDGNAYPPSYANDPSYGTVWDSGDTPTAANPIWLALDLSSVAPAHRQQVVLAWFNDAGDYIHLPSTVNYNLPSNYTIDANPAAGGTSTPPSAGWTTLLTVTGNSNVEREHPLNLTGYNWVRMRITGVKGSSGNMDAAFNLDIYDVSAGDQDDWLFLGDSITAEGTAHANIAGGDWSGGDYAQLVNAGTSHAYYPIQLDGGIGGWTSADGAANISALLNGFTGHFVSLAYGTNDANEPYLLSTSQIQTYYTNMLAMIAAVQSAGKVAVVPYVIWGCNGQLGANANALNNYVNQHLAADAPQVIRGPDLWTPFSQNRGWISSDCIHPTYSAPSGQLNGFEQYQRVWEKWSVTTLYTAAAAPSVSLNPTSLGFGNQSVGVASAAQTITLTNTGTAPLSISSVALAGTNAGDFAQTNTCPINPNALAAGATCAISVTFTPAATGARAASVAIADNAAGSPQAVALSGTGVVLAPAVTLNPTSVSFGNQNVGTTSTVRTITLTNSGTAALGINSIALVGTNVGDFAQTNTCPLNPNTLAAGANCTLSVTFTPATTGARTASVSISDSAADSPQSAGLSGAGVVPAPVVSLAPTTLAFGSQNVGATGATQMVTLTNTGTMALTISSVALAGLNAGDFSQSNTCPISPSTLAVNGTCTISVTFAPTAAGTRSASVSISDNASDSPQAVALSGTGVVPTPGISLAPTNLSFGSQIISTTSTAQSVTLTNNGTAALAIDAIALMDSNAGDFAQSNTCPINPSTLAAGATCTISVTFTPTATGARVASVSVSDNAAGSPQSVTLGGTGVTHTAGVSLVASASANGNFGAGVKIKIPTVQAGDLLIAVVGTNGAPASWTTPAGWTAGANSGHPDGQGLNWWWKIAAGTESGTMVTLKASSYTDGGGVVLDYRGAASAPIQAVSTLATNDNGGNGRVGSAQFNGVSWSGSQTVVSLLLMSWQPAATAVTWPSGYAPQATATDGYGFVAVGANLTNQATGSLAAQTATCSVTEAVVPTLQIAVLVGP